MWKPQEPFKYLGTWKGARRSSPPPSAVCGKRRALCKKFWICLAEVRTLGSAINTDLDAHELLHRGLPRGALTSLIENLHAIHADEASEALGVSLRTLQRHKAAPVERLDVPQSGRAWKFAEILARATRVFGSQDEAEQWLKRPAIGLDQQRPIDLLTTPAGVKLVEDYLGRIEYSVYT